MAEAPPLAVVQRVGGEPKLGKLCLPRTGCVLPGGQLVVAEFSAPPATSCLAVLSLERAELIRHVLPEERGFESPSALLLADGGEALIVVESHVLTKLRWPSGAPLARREESPLARCFCGAALVDGVLYVADHRTSAILAFDGGTLHPRRERFGRMHAPPPTYNPNDWFTPEPPLEPDALVEPCAVRPHPEGIMCVDVAAKRILVFSVPSGELRREYAGFARPFDAACHAGLLLVSDGDAVVAVDVASGRHAHRLPLGDERTWACGLLPLDGAAVCVIEPLPLARLHLLHVGAPHPSPRADAPLRLAPAEQFDLCVVGAGAVGCALARDVAACGYTVLLLERAAEVGGVWSLNKYPGLRLHSPGASYRALSLAPEWQADDRRAAQLDRQTYRPFQEEILAYVQSLAVHPNITVRTSTTFCFAEREGGKEGRHRVVCDSLVASARAVAHCRGTYEVTAGKAFSPFDVSAVTNGAKVVHSSQLSAHKAEFDGAKHRYLIGASKAAIDVLGTLTPSDEALRTMTWAHRGHIIFTNRDNIIRDMVAVAEAKEKHTPSEMRQALAAAREGAINGTNTANQLLRKQQFEGYCKMYLSSGRGVVVGEPVSKQGIAQRGGIEAEAVIEHCRKFLPCQKLLKSIRVADGALQLAHEGGGVTVPGPGDVVVLCTGQRAEGFGPGYHRSCAQHNRDGIFKPFAVSGTALCVSAYWTSMVVSYLDGTPSAYSNGSFAAAAEKVAEHMENLRDSSPWACFMTYLSSNQLDVAPLVFPWAAVGAGDLASSPRWLDWYGRHLDVRAACKLLSQRTFVEADDSGATQQPTGRTSASSGLK